MAVFERKKEDRVVIDDSKPYLLEIKETQNIGDHIEYKIEVCRYPDVDEKWFISHRFSNFVALHSALKTPTINLPALPPKKVFGNTDKDFIINRKCLLQTYLKKLLENYFVSISPQFVKFVDPSSLEPRFTEEAHQNLLLSLRSSGSHEISQRLPKIGTRLRKTYFLANPLKDLKQHAIWWAPYGPDRVKHLRDVHASLTALLQCQGSLRDYIYGVKPQFDFLLKYSNNKRRNIPIKTCAIYGRQILEALCFLHEKGIAHGSLHTGNVVIENNVCQLMELENQIVGFPHPLRRFMIKLKKVNSPQAADIYSFGHLLYEMVFHDPLLSETCDDFPKEASPLCRSVLESILSSEACKNGLPSASGLLTHPFFCEVPLVSCPKPSLRISPLVKQCLESTYTAWLERLRQDQKKVKLQRQIYRAEELLSLDRNYPNSHRNKKESRVGNGNDSRIFEKDIDTSINDSPTIDSDSLQEKACPEISSNDSLPTSSVTTETQQPQDSSSNAPSRNNLLSSISNFDKSNLKKAVSNRPSS